MGMKLSTCEYDVATLIFNFEIPIKQIKWVHHMFSGYQTATDDYYKMLSRGPMNVSLKYDNDSTNSSVSFNLDRLFREMFDEGYKWVEVQTPSQIVRLPLRRNHLKCKNMRQFMSWLPSE